MVAKIKINETGDCIFTEQDAIELLYTDPSFDISKLYFDNTEQYNNSVSKTALNYSKLKELPERPAVDIFDKNNIENRYMPEQYYQIDVLDWLLAKCQTQEEKDRVNLEYKLFEQKKFIKVLQFLIYFVDTLRKNNIVWGVGRGSSVASFCLFLIGIHKINPLQYNLNITEFLR